MEGAAAVVCASLVLGLAAVVFASVSELSVLPFCLFLKSRHELSLVGIVQCSVIVLEVLAASISEQPLLIRHCSKRPN